MSIYRVYAEVPDAHAMTLRGYTAEMHQAVMACNALMAGRPLPAYVFPESGADSVITGIPVWVRYRPGRAIAVMVTENTGIDEARQQEAAVAALPAVA